VRGASLAQLEVDPTLDDAEHELPRRRLAGPAAPGPDRRAPHGVRDPLPLDPRRRALVERHRDVRPEQALDLHRELGREAVPRAVVDRTELDAVVLDRRRVAQREHLVAAGVRQDRAVPAHEAVQAAEAGDAFGSRAKVQVIGVPEHDLGAQVAQLAGKDGLDRRLGADRHEDRRLDGAVGGVEHARPGVAVDGLEVEPAGHRMSIASPKE
jgi:hypothetical protein